MRNPIVRLLFADPESPQPSNPRLFAQDVIRIKEFSGCGCNSGRRLAGLEHSAGVSDART
jgi:hypothetical protein